MSILYLFNDYIVEYPLLSDLFSLFLACRLKCLNHALVQTGNLYVILKFSIDKFQLFHRRDDLVNWEIYLKQYLNELRERGAETEVV